MGGEIYFSSGDLLEYTREMAGKPDLPDRMAVRAVVMGFEVRLDGKITIWLYEGAMANEPESVQLELDDEGEPRMEARTYDTPKHPEFCALGLDYLLSLEPEVVRHGNSPREMTMFMLGGEPYGD